MKKNILVSLMALSIILGVVANIRISSPAYFSKTSSKSVEKNEENVTVPKSITLKGDYSTFLSTIFDIDGSIYVDENKNTFYSNPECNESDAISNSSELHFISNDIDYGKNSKGFRVSCLLTEDGNVVYCLSSTPVRLTNIDYLD